MNTAEQTTGASRWSDASVVTKYELKKGDGRGEKNARAGSSTSKSGERNEEASKSRDPRQCYRTAGFRTVIRSRCGNRQSCSPRCQHGRGRRVCPSTGHIRQRICSASSRIPICDASCDRPRQHFGARPELRKGRRDTEVEVEKIPSS